MASYSPKLPLELDKNESFDMISDSLVNIKQKLRTILLTNPGEKIFDPEFGVGVSRYIFEPAAGTVNVTTVNNKKLYSIDDFSSFLLPEIVKQINKYSLDIDIKDVQTSVTDQVLYISINYTYRGFVSDTLSININDQRTINE